jgi:hypothetical protein
MDNLNGTGVALVERTRDQPKTDEIKRSKRKREEVKPNPGSRAESFTADEKDSLNEPQEDQPNKESFCSLSPDEIQVPK